MTMPGDRTWIPTLSILAALSSACTQAHPYCRISSKAAGSPEAASSCCCCCSHNAAEADGLLCRKCQKCKAHAKPSGLH